MGVFGADDRGEPVEEIQGPRDVKGWVVPEDGALAEGVVEVGGFVEDLGGVGEDQEAVSEAFGDPEELEWIGGRWRLEVESCPFSEVG